MNLVLPLRFTRPARQLDSADSSAKLRTMPKSPAPFSYVDLFAGIGGFHAMLDHAGGRCVYVSEIDREARNTYLRNWVDHLPEAERPIINTDITRSTRLAEEHGWRAMRIWECAVRRDSAVVALAILGRPSSPTALSAVGD